MTSQTGLIHSPAHKCILPGGKDCLRLSCPKKRGEKKINKKKDEKKSIKKEKNGRNAKK